MHNFIIVHLTTIFGIILSPLFFYMGAEGENKRLKGFLSCVVSLVFYFILIQIAKGF